MREAITQALTDNGLSGIGELHSWRCQFPQTYGECTCIADLVDDVVKAVEPAIQSARASAQWAMWDEFADVGGVEDTTLRHVALKYNIEDERVPNE